MSYHSSILPRSLTLISPNCQLCKYLRKKMPVTTLFTSAATFLYAISTLLGGGAQHTPLQGPVPVPSVNQDIPPPINTDASYGSSTAQFYRFNETTNSPSLQPFFAQRRNQVDKLVELRARARGLVTLLSYRPSQYEDRKYQQNGLSDTDHRNHEQQMADTIFRQILTHTFRSNASSPAPLPDEITYYDKETIATIYMDANGNVTRCRLIEVVEPEDSDRVLQMIADKNKLIEKTTFRTILTIITACQALDPKKSKAVNGDSSYNEHTKPIQFSSINMTSQYNMWSIVSGILPGTKWCGLGDISSSYDDLGTERNLDKCCRAHDHCPIKVKAFRSRYGLLNWSLYTKSHCECDSLLYDCLKRASTPTAEMLGNFYFNVLRIQCVDEEEPVTCAARDPATGACKLWQPDTRQPKRMLFKSVQRDF